MRRICLLLIAVLLAAVPAFAQTGNGAPNGPHFNLNIIGVDNPKTATMTNTDRHTIFVALGKNGMVTTNIYLQPAADFAVCDGNGFDTAYDCNGNSLGKQGATFQLPCNTHITDTTYEIVACDPTLVPTASYEVWARALGKPNGHATMTTCAYDPILGETICSMENVLLLRTKGQQKFTDVTDQLTTLVYDYDADGTIERVALFMGGLEDWFWQYQNKGLRLAQLRFYPL